MPDFIDSDDLTTQQKAAVIVLTHPDHIGMSLTAASEKIGVCRKTLYNWRKSDAFNAAMKEALRGELEYCKRDVFNALVHKATVDKDVTAIRTYLELTGEFDAAKKSDLSGIKIVIERPTFVENQQNNQYNAP